MQNNELELQHWGIKGMKWGVRRYQNKDGSLTPAGKKRYLDINDSDSDVTKKAKEDYNNMSDQEFMRKYQVSKDRYAKRVDKYGDPYMKSPLAKVGKGLSSIHKRREDYFVNAASNAGKTYVKEIAGNALLNATVNGLVNSAMGVKGRAYTETVLVSTLSGAVLGAASGYYKVQRGKRIARERQEG